MCLLKVHFSCCIFISIFSLCSFYYFAVSVTDWASLKRVRVRCSPSFEDFKKDVKKAFEKSKNCSIYRLPADFNDIEQRQRVTTDEDYAELLDDVTNDKPPLVYVWDEPESPLHLPKTFLRLSPEQSSATSDRSVTSDGNSSGTSASRRASSFASQQRSSNAACANAILPSPS